MIFFNDIITNYYFNNFNNNKKSIQCESGFIESPLSEINFLISLVWAEGGIDVGDPMLKIEKCCEGDRSEIRKLISSHLAFHDKRIKL